MDIKDLERIVVDTVRGHLAFDGLKSVVVESEEDIDGDAILRVSIVLDEKNEKLDPRKMLALVRHIRASLTEVNESRFPLVSYFDQRDYSALHREAA
ncbi:hypothetical protein [Roseomonas mucosa]|uniref:hypothetical protein n=1 Tax=Roseomonas mucosa TaxID=207340 RepID=UPI0028CEBC47|nr:hypothetical protein [Roseomonas mucosa]MDT8276687.1 hypothetical protein [Roseomonas mucosa]MDT8355265.1 hypothetical protein [Roseomonas mucosa]